MPEVMIGKLIDFLKVNTKPEDILESGEIEGEDVKTEDVLDQNLPDDDERNDKVMVCDQCGSEFNIDLDGGKNQLCPNCKIPMRKKSRYEAKKKLRKREVFDSKKSTKAQRRGTCVFQSASSKVTDDKDHFPVNNIGQARNALARAGQYTASPPWYKGSLASLRKAITNTVKRTYPSIKVTEDLDISYQKDEVIDTGKMQIDLPINQCLNCGYVFERGIKDVLACPKCESKELDSIYYPETTTSTIIKEFDNAEYKVIASGIPDRDVADRLARDKKGDVAEDPADETKFVVIIKEYRGYKVGSPYVNPKEYDVVATGIRSRNVANGVAKEKGGIVMTDPEDPNMLIVVVKQGSKNPIKSSILPLKTSVSKEILEAMFDEKYEKTVNVEIYTDTPGEDDGNLTEYQTLIKYTMEVEARDWGIKDMEVSITEDVEVRWEDGEGDEHSVTIKPDDITINWVAGKHFYPTDLVVHLVAEKTVKSAELTFYYIEM